MAQPKRWIIHGDDVFDLTTVLLKYLLRAPMASLLKKIARGSERRPSTRGEPRRCSEPVALLQGKGDQAAKLPPPLPPPSPTLAHLTTEELQVLSGVFSRLERFDQEETARISTLKSNLESFEETVQQQAAARSRLKHVDLRLCRLCYKTKFADGIGRVCHICHRRVCQRCGSFVRTQWEPEKNKYVKGRWVCKLCKMRRELAAASGIWFNGGQAKPHMSIDTLNRKLSDVTINSDWGSADIEQSDSSVHKGPAGHKTDSELHTHSKQACTRQSSREEGSGRSVGHGSLKRQSRRRISSAGDAMPDGCEDEDIDVDDELFLLERQKCRMARIQMHQKKTRKKGPRRASVGTSTEEDSGMLTEYTIVECPKHGVTKQNSVESQLRQSPESGKNMMANDRDRRKLNGSACKLSGSPRRQDGRANTDPLGRKNVGRMRKERNNSQEMPSPTRSEREQIQRLDPHDNSYKRPRQRNMSNERESNSEYNYIRPIDTRNRDGHRRRSRSQDPRRNSMFQTSKPTPSPRGPEHSRISRLSRESGRSSSDGEHSDNRGARTGHTLTVPAPGSPSQQRRSSDSIAAQAANLSVPHQNERRVSDPGTSYRSANGKQAAKLEHSLITPYTAVMDEISAGRNPRLSPLPVLAASCDGNFETTAVPFYFKDCNSVNPGSVQIVPLIITKQSSMDSSLEGELLADIQRRLSNASQASSAQRSIEKRNSDGSVQSAGGTSRLGTSRDGDQSMSYKPQKLLRRSSSTHHFRVVLKRDSNDTSCRTGGLGMRVVGGKMGPDGKLGAFVTHVIKEGPADLANIMEADQILEWDGSSLEDATFEEAQQILARSGDTVQLLVMHTRMGLEKRAEDNGILTAGKDAQQKGGESGGGSVDGKKVEGKRRMSEHQLERARERALRVENWLSESKNNDESNDKVYGDGREVSGRLQMKLWHDARARTLAVSVLRAQDLMPRPGPEKDMPSAYCKLYWLKDNSMTQLLRTETVESNKNPEWGKSYTLHDIETERLKGTSVMAVLWDLYPSKQDVFVGEVLLDLATADLQESSLWYPLEKHDENCGRLPVPSPKGSELGVRERAHGEDSQMHWSSLPMIPATPAHDKMKELLGKRGSQGRHSFTKTVVGNGSPGSEDFVSSAPMLKMMPRKSPSSPEIEIQPVMCLSSPDVEDLRRKGRVGKLKLMKRRMSEIALKVGAILQDKRDPSQQSLTTKDISAPMPMCPRRHSLSYALDSADSDMNSPGPSHKLLPQRGFLRQSSQSSGMGISSTTASEDDDFESNQQRPAPEGDDVTSMLGPAQVPPKPSQEKLIQGDIKLGFIITKGQLEVDIMCAKGLTLNSAGQPPDTYVKTCLVGNGKKFQRKKTKISRETTDPRYMQKIKYSACNVHGRYLQISIKEKTTGFEKNNCVGEVVVKLDSMDLSSNTSGWYKLFKQSAAEFGSSDSLSIAF